MADTTVLSIDYIVKTPGVCSGLPRIDGTRITVDWIVGQMIYAGRTTDDMVADYAHIPLQPAQIHAALAYYYDHRNEIDRLITENEQMLEEIKQRQLASNQNDFVTARQAAEILGVDHESRHIAKLCREGVVQCKKIANRWMVLRSSIEAYADSYRKPGPRPSE